MALVGSMPDVMKFSKVKLSHVDEEVESLAELVRWAAAAACTDLSSDST